MRRAGTYSGIRAARSMVTPAQIAGWRAGTYPSACDCQLTASSLCEILGITQHGKCPTPSTKMGIDRNTVGAWQIYRDTLL